MAGQLSYCRLNYTGTDGRSDMGPRYGSILWFFIMVLHYGSSLWFFIIVLHNGSGMALRCNFYLTQVWIKDMIVVRKQGYKDIFIESLYPVCTLSLVSLYGFLLQ